MIPCSKPASQGWSSHFRTCLPCHGRREGWWCVFGKSSGMGPPIFGSFYIQLRWENKTTSFQKTVNKMLCPAFLQSRLSETPHPQDPSKLKTSLLLRPGGWSSPKRGFRLWGCSARAKRIFLKAMLCVTRPRNPDRHARHRIKSPSPEQTSQKKHPDWERSCVVGPPERTKPGIRMKSLKCSGSQGKGLRACDLQAPGFPEARKIGQTTHA